MASETLDIKDDVLGILKNYKVEFYEKYGISNIGLFGSIVRGENNEKSDIDILYEYDSDTHKLTLFKLEDFRLYLENILGSKVDIGRGNVYLKNKDIRDYLNDTIDAAAKILEFTQGITSHYEFIKNDMLLSAVIGKLEIIGKAIKRVPINVRERYRYPMEKYSRCKG